MKQPYLDISVPLQPGITQWPTQQDLEIRTLADHEEQQHHESEVRQLNMHLGTHIDAPLHFIPNGNSLQAIGLDRLMGPAQVISITGCAVVTADHLAEADIHEATTRLLIHTDNSAKWDHPTHKFDPDYCALDASAARWLIDHDIDLVGIDYLSIQKFNDGPEVHQLLLGAEVIILETLDLRDISPGMYHLICLPLRINDVEGAPARAILQYMRADY
jgi:arylformamidase